MIGAVCPEMSLNTTDLDEARRLLTAHFRIDSQGVKSATPALFRFDFQSRTSTEFTLSSVGWFGEATTKNLMCPDSVMITEVQEGRQALTSGEIDLRLDRGDLAVFPHDPVDSLHVDSHHRFLSIKRTAIHEAAAAVGVAGSLKFVDWTPVSRAAARQYRRTMNYTESCIRDAEVAASPLAVATITSLLARTVLATFPNASIGTESDRRDHYEASAAERAVSFVQENLAQNIGVAEIARAARVSERSVNELFRRRFGQPPMRYVRGLRLDAAHRELRETEPRRTTVKQVALKWGFPSAPHFTAMYRQRFNTTPSETLHGFRRR